MSCTAAGIPHLRHRYTTLHVPLDYCNTYTYCVTNGSIYLYIRTRVCECSPIIINIIIRTNPKTMTFSACGRGSSTTATLSFALLPYLTIHGGRWTATTQWRPSHIIRLKKSTLNVAIRLNLYKIKIYTRRNIFGGHQICFRKHYYYI